MSTDARSNKVTIDDKNYIFAIDRQAGKLYTINEFDEDSALPFIAGVYNNLEIKTYKAGLTGLMLQTDKIRSKAQDICDAVMDKLSILSGAISMKLDKNLGTENNDCWPGREHYTR